MGKVFHPVMYLNESDDVAGGSWSEPYFQPHGGEDTRRPLRETNCGVEDPILEDEQYSDGKTAAHAVATLRAVAPAAKDPSNPKPFFVAVGFHRPHLPWVVPARYFALYNRTTIQLADHRTRPQNYNITGAQDWSWDPQSGPRHCLPLANKTAFPGEYDLVPDAVALHFRRSYLAAVSQMDAQVGKVLRELEVQGLDSSTVIAFLGECAASPVLHQLTQATARHFYPCSVARAAPLRSHGWQLGDLGEFGKKTNFERATRAPLIVRNPSSTAAAATSSALVEFVDLMPTLMGLALGTSAVPPLCPPVSSSVALCTEGQSLAPLMADPAGTRETRAAVFMQYAYCMHDAPGGAWHDQCDSDSEPHVMGYAMRTRRWRYVEWVRFNKTTLPPTPLWDHLLGTELYDHSVADTVENVAESVNRVADPALQDKVAALSRQLHAGWQGRSRWGLRGS